MKKEKSLIDPYNTKLKWFKDKDFGYLKSVSPEMPFYYTICTFQEWFSLSIDPKDQFGPTGQGICQRFSTMKEAKEVAEDHHEAIKTFVNMGFRTLEPQIKILLNTPK